MTEQPAASDWPAFAGIDWGGSEHQVCVLDTAGARLTQVRVTHDVAGLAELDTALARHGTVLPIAVERAEGVLVEHLQARGHHVFAVSPRIAARARERYRVAAVKDDRLDAFVLADTLRHEHPHWRALTPPSPLLAEIKALTRDRDRLQWVRALLHSVYDQPDAASVHAQFDRILNALGEKLPTVAEHLDTARADVLAFTAFPKEVWRQINQPHHRRSARYAPTELSCRPRRQRIANLRTAASIRPAQRRTGAATP